VISETAYRLLLAAQGGEWRRVAVVARMIVDIILDQRIW